MESSDITASQSVWSLAEGLVHMATGTATSWEPPHLSLMLSTGQKCLIHLKSMSTAQRHGTLLIGCIWLLLGQFTAGIKWEVIRKQTLAGQNWNESGMRVSLWGKRSIYLFFDESSHWLRWQAPSGAVVCHPEENGVTLMTDMNQKKLKTWKSFASELSEVQNEDKCTSWNTLLNILCPSHLLYTFSTA